MTTRRGTPGFHAGRPSRWNAVPTSACGLVATVAVDDCPEAMGGGVFPLRSPHAAAEPRATSVTPSPATTTRARLTYSGYVLAREAAPIRRRGRKVRPTRAAPRNAAAIPRRPRPPPVPASSRCCGARPASIAVGTRADGVPATAPALLVGAVACAPLTVGPLLGVLESSGTTTGGLFSSQPGRLGSSSQFGPGPGSSSQNSSGSSPARGPRCRPGRTPRRRRRRTPPGLRPRGPRCRPGRTPCRRRTPPGLRPRGPSRCRPRQNSGQALRLLARRCRAVDRRVGREDPFRHRTLGEHVVLREVRGHRVGAVGGDGALHRRSVLQGVGHTLHRGDGDGAERVGVTVVRHALSHRGDLVPLGARAGLSVR